jgi:hypothetical protein
VDTKQVEKQLFSEVPYFKTCVYSSCTRRRVWDLNGPPQADGWRYARGMMLLDYLVESCHLVKTPYPFHVFTHRNHMVAYRGGPWNPQWGSDLVDEWALYCYINPIAPLHPEIWVLHEHNGRLEIVVLPVEPFDIDAHAKELLKKTEADPPTRIRKDTVYAAKVCRFCPHKRTCDATDALRNQTDDYSPNYPIP